MIDFKKELDQMYDSLVEIAMFAENYVRVPQMHWSHALYFSHLYFTDCAKVQQQISDYIDDLENSHEGSYERLFKCIVLYNNIFFDIQDYTKEGRMKPWHYRHQEICEGGDDFEDELEYERSLKYLFSFKNLKIPEKYIYGGD